MLIPLKQEQTMSPANCLFDSLVCFLPPCPLLPSHRHALHKCSTSRNIVPIRKRLRARITPTAVTNTTPHSRTDTSSNLDSLLENRDKRRFIFFGGKGGVGKTSSAAAVAIKAADEGLTTLVISTDPAHSLGDALRVDLSDGNLRQISPDLELYAIESDTREAVAKFRNLVASLNAPGTSSVDEGGWGSVAKRLGLQEFSEVLETIPPGADELIALVSVLDLVESENPDKKFDRVIIDTAPTGHTLRFLSFPDFLDKFLTQALSFRDKLNNAQGLVGNVAKMFVGKKVDVNKALEIASKRVAEYRDKMIALSDLFRDPERTEFVVVTIATVLAVEESKRLIQRLWDDGIWVRHVIVNQIVPAGNSETIGKYLSKLRKGQAQEISFATEVIADEYGLAVSTVPRFDTEVRGLFGLGALGDIAFREKRQQSYGKLFDESIRAKVGSDSLFVFVGGKGGVGKTSVSASLGVKLAMKGLKTLILSTDPAHSLGDALQIGLDGGTPVRLNMAEGELYAMEIDTEKAIRSFQGTVKEYVAEGRKGGGVDFARKLGLEEFAGLLDNAPPGIDELVALTQVMELVRYGDFDRVVIDTAPTGHTLRLLSFPEFLDEFLGKVMRLKQRLDSAIDTLRNVLGRKDSADAVDRAAQGIERLRENMEELGQLVKDKERTQFVLVSVPTGLAMAESERLVKSLRADEVQVKNLVINQVIPDGCAQSYVERIVKNQDANMERLRVAGRGKGIGMVEVPFFDVEVRGIYGLRAMSDSMFSVGQ